MQTEFRISIEKSYEGRFYGTLMRIPINAHGVRIIQDKPSETLQAAIDEIESRYIQQGRPRAIFHYSGNTYKTIDAAKEAILRDAASGKI